VLPDPAIRDNISCDRPYTGAFYARLDDRDDNHAQAKAVFDEVVDDYVRSYEQGPGGLYYGRLRE
jgi:hypothetical protein